MTQRRAHAVQSIISYVGIVALVLAVALLTLYVVRLGQQREQRQQQLCALENAVRLIVRKGEETSHPYPDEFYALSYRLLDKVGCEP